MLVAGAICGSLVVSTCCACCCLQHKRRKVAERRRLEEEEERKEEREDSGRDLDEGRRVTSDTLAQWQAQVKGRRVSSTNTSSMYAVSSDT